MFNFYSKWLSVSTFDSLLYVCWYFVIPAYWTWKGKDERSLKCSCCYFVLDFLQKSCLTLVCFLIQNKFLTSENLVFYYLKGISKCKLMPCNHNPWTASMCSAMVFAPAKTRRCLCVRYRAYPFALIEVCQSSLWWGKSLHQYNLITQDSVSHHASVIIFVLVDPKLKLLLPVYFSSEQSSEIKREKIMIL